MRACTFEDWTEAVTESYFSLRKRGEPIVLIGAGLGANLCAVLSQRLFPRALVGLAPIADTRDFSRLGTQTQTPDMVSMEAYLTRDCSDALTRWRQSQAHLDIPLEFAKLAQRTVEQWKTYEAGRAVQQLWIHRDATGLKADEFWDIATANTSKVTTLALDSPSRVIWLSEGRMRLFREVVAFIETL